MIAWLRWRWAWHQAAHWLYQAQQTGTPMAVSRAQQHLDRIRYRR